MWPRWGGHEASSNEERVCSLSLCILNRTDKLTASCQTRVIDHISSDRISLHTLYISPPLSNLYISFLYLSFLSPHYAISSKNLSYSSRFILSSLWLYVSLCGVSHSSIHIWYCNTVRYFYTSILHFSTLNTLSIVFCIYIIRILYYTVHTVHVHNIVKCTL